MAVVKASKDVLPEDVYKILLNEQGKEKLRRGNGQFGLQATNWLIVRKWAKGILPDEFKEPTNYAQQAIEATKAQCLANIMAQVDTVLFDNHPSAVIRDVIMKTEIKLP